MRPGKDSAITRERSVCELRNACFQADREADKLSPAWMAPRLLFKSTAGSCRGRPKDFSTLTGCTLTLGLSGRVHECSDVRSLRSGPYSAGSISSIAFAARSALVSYGCRSRSSPVIADQLLHRSTAT